MEIDTCSPERDIAIRSATSRRLSNRRKCHSFFRSNCGMAAAEVALLALIFVAMALWVGNKLVPAMRTAAECLNAELSGGAACSSLSPSKSKRN